MRIEIPRKTLFTETRGLNKISEMRKRLRAYACIIAFNNAVSRFSLCSQSHESLKDWTKLGEDPSTKNDITMKVEMRLKDWVLRNNFTSSGLQGDSQEMVYIGICAPNEILLGWGFVSVYQKCYTALFLICLVIVGILYGMIYHFIGMRRYDD